MRRTIPLALLLAVGMASPAAANFLGSAVRLEIAHPTTTTPIATPTVATVVTPGVEFPNVKLFELPGALVVPTAIDLTATSITIDFDNAIYQYFAFGTFNGYILTDHNDTLPDFSGITIDSTVTTLGIAPERLTVTPNQIFINVSGLIFSPSTFAKFDVTFGSTATPPTQPTALQAAVSGNLLTLAWQPPSTPPSGYLIEAGTAPGLANIASVGVAANPPGITAPVPNGTYYIRVRAIYPSGPGSPSNEVAVTVGCTGPPVAPAGFGVTQGPGGNPIHFSWAPSAAVTAFRLEAGSAPGLANLATINLAGSATVFDVQAPPGSYFVRLRALNACGMSAPSTEVIVTIGSGCLAPSAPQNLVASVSGQVVNLSWSPPATGTAPFTYTLLAGSSSGASNLATVPMGAATSMQAPVPNGTYFVRVMAANACGVSGPSNEAVAQVVGLGAPQLTFSITPNPVPYAGIHFANCADSTGFNKSWFYTLRITNQGPAPFVASSFSGRVTSPLLPQPIDVAHPSSNFALAFGGSTIAPQASLQGLLCVYGNWEDATLQWTFNHVGGGSFTAPVITFLRP